MKGKVQIESVGSMVLRENPLGDPRLREVPVYLPPSYGSQRGRRYPIVYFLTGFTGNGKSTLNTKPWKENLVERLDRLIASGQARECVLVLPDCFTAYGGSQYLNSEATGRYEDHVVSELVPFFEDKLAISRQSSGRAVMGQSSGGYGALMLGMKHPGTFGHVACHSGDMFFEMCYGMDIPKFVTLLGKYGGSALRFTKEFLASKNKGSFDPVGINMIAMAACYAPNRKSPLGFDLPFDERTGELKPKIWARWKESDPVTVAARFKANLKRLETLYFDCGSRDEFYLHLGARKLAEVLNGLRVRHAYEEHSFGHFDMADRYDHSLKLLTSRLKP